MKVLSTLLLILIYPIFLSSQAWTERISFESAYERLDIMITGDVDQDGDEDIISNSRTFGSKEIFWMENLDGSGNFAADQMIIATEHFITSMALGDLDADGDLDLLATFLHLDGDNFFAWFENLDGQGNFGQQQIIATYPDQTLGNIALADLNLDGHLDISLLLSESNTVNTIIWFKNLGAATNFEAQSTLQLIDPSPIASYSLADIDDDGDMDILTASAVAFVWYANDGQGTFAIGQPVGSTDNGYYPYSAMTDIDLDGDLDIVAYRNQFHRIVWLEHLDGQGTFSAEKVIADEGINIFGGFLIHFVDMDTDGDPDVLFTRKTNTGIFLIAWHENLDGLGNFGPEAIILESPLNIQRVFPIDIDTDEDLDIIAYNIDDYSFWWQENTNAQADFSTPQYIRYGIANPRSKDVADIDADGDPDLLIATDRGIISWFENLDGLGNMSPPKTIGYIQATWPEAHLKDVDGDQDQDVILYRTFGNEHELLWYKNLDGQGTFGDSISIESTNNIAYMFPIDFEGDGDVDIVANVQSNLVWYENIDGLGQFSERQSLNWSFINHPIYPIDLDQDQDIDFVYLDDDAIHWREQLPNGQWNTHLVQEFDVSNTGRIHFGDLNNDEKVDILYNDPYDTSAAITWFMQEDNQGSFSEATIATNTSLPPVTVHLADIDRDGDEDLIVYTFEFSNSTKKIVWFENLDGMGSFGDEHLIAEGASIPGFPYIKLVDMDGDEDLDISSAWGDDKIVWFENAELTSIRLVESTKHKISVYPNPFSVSATLLVQDLNPNAIYQIQVLSLTGQLVRQYSLNPATQSSITISGIQSGIYLYRLLQGGDQTLIDSGRLIVTNH